MSKNRFPPLPDLIATLGPVGYLPRVPGTWGSAAAILLWWFLLSSRPVTHLLVVIFIVSLIGIWAANSAEKRLGHDSGKIVIDEVAGQWLVLAVCKPEILQVSLAFVLFRGFDILKPFPVGVSQRLPGGLGIVIDDLLAALYSIGVLLLIGRVFGV